MRLQFLVCALFSSLSISLLAQEGRFIKIKNGSCKIWSEPYSTGDSVIWKGPCKNGYTAGSGDLIWYDGQSLVATYQGQMDKGRFDGDGILTVLHYGTFKGHFVNGQLHGLGEVILDDGGHLKGNFDKGNLLDLDPEYLKLLHRQTMPLRDESHIYNTDTSKEDLFYYALVPKQAIATLVLFPSTGESVESVISCNKQLIQLAYQKHIAYIVVSSNFNKGLETDKVAMRFFNAVFSHAINKYNLPKNHFILCGLSLGGENALRYTELSREGKTFTSISPMAIIAVDPPIDMVDLYNHAVEQNSYYEKEGNKLSETKAEAMRENHFLIKYFTELYGGTPQEFPERYEYASPFSRKRIDGGNARFLTQVPVRAYTDPDILWQMKYKGRDYYHMNAANLSSLILFLQNAGNSKAEFIPALGKGFRLDGKRHPHSWSIVDPEDAVAWMTKLLETE